MSWDCPELSISKKKCARGKKKGKKTKQKAYKQTNKQTENTKIRHFFSTSLLPPSLTPPTIHHIQRQTKINWSGTDRVPLRHVCVTTLVGKKFLFTYMYFIMYITDKQYCQRKFTANNNISDYIDEINKACLYYTPTITDKYNNQNIIWLADTNCVIVYQRR